MKFQKMLEQKNKTRVRILKDLTPIQKHLSWLRRAEKAGDEEVVNNTVLGRLREQDIKFEVLK
jgi:hypothetical protein